MIPAHYYTRTHALLKMLTEDAPWLWANPALDPPEERTALAEARLRHPVNVAQPFTPSQYALILRWDFLTIWHELIRRRAQVDSLRESRAAALAAAYKAWPHAEDLAENVAGIVEQLATERDEALQALRVLQGVRPSNWDDGDDPEQQAAWAAAERLLDGAQP